MWTELLEEFEKQEKEDKDRMTTMLETAIREELDCPEHYIDILRGSSFRPGDILKLSVKDTPVRVSSGVSIRKHTLCQIPYYHTHDFYELIYVYQGNAGQYLPGEKTAFKMSAGDICLLTPGKIHAMLPSEEDDIILKMILPRQLMRKIMEELSSEERYKEQADILEKRNELYLFRAVKEETLPMKKVMESLMLELYSEQGYKMPSIITLLLLLFIGLGQRDMEYRRSGLVYAVTDYIQRNICTAAIDALAVQMGYSSRHLARRISEETGGNFSDMLMHMRVQRAAELLAETDLTMDEVARQSGYSSTSGLYKRFHCVYGMSPGEYRKIYRHQEGR